MPNWQTLPELFKISVVEKLDLQSRFALQRCSKLDHQLVAKCPIILESMEIFFPPAKGVILKIQETPDWSTRRSLALPAVPDVVRFFQLPHLQIHGLKILGPEPRLYQVAHLTSQLESLIKNDGKFKIQVNELYWRCTPEDKAAEFIRFLAIFDADFLEIIHNDMCKFSKEQLEKLGEMEQLKKCKKIHLANASVSSVEQFLNVEKCTVLFEELTVEHIWKMIESFIFRDVPIGSSFYFQSGNPPKLVDVFSTYNIPLKHQPIVPDDIGIEGRHTQRFEMPSAGKFLAVRNTEIGVRGDVLKVE